jgi:predicted lipoprotein with Yx(FWY)xxD motif
MLSGTDLPQTPSEISILREGDKYVFCVGESQAIYSNKLDSPNQSNCYGKCSELWPPVIAKGGGARVGSWNVIARSDNLTQWTYKSRPVYTYARDAPGEARGEGIGGIWHQVGP